MWKDQEMYHLECYIVHEGRRAMQTANCMTDKDEPRWVGGASSTHTATLPPYRWRRAARRRVWRGNQVTNQTTSSSCSPDCRENT